MAIFNDIDLADKFSELNSYGAEVENENKIKKKKVKRKLATFDIETDPFLYGRIPQPFCCGILIEESKDERQYHEFWGEDCITKLIEFLWMYPDPLKIYAHNGGKFDFIYLLYTGLLEGEPRIINGRIVEAKLAHHILRDSYAIIPVPLGAYEKTKIDYSTFEAEERENYKLQILEYLKDDCIFLLDLVSAFHERFNDNLTVGSLAIKKLQEAHPFARISQSNDELIRAYYFGGRVQCFEKGSIKGKFKIYDVNSMYPAVMSQTKHIIGDDILEINNDLERFIDPVTGELLGAYKGQPYFIKFTGKNFNAIPKRDKDGSLNFTVEEGIFHSCSHEIKVGLKYGLIKIESVEQLLIAQETIIFDDYVNEYIKDKIEGKEAGDKIKELFAKLLLNSAYGKTAQNPANYFDWLFVEPDEYDRIIRDNTEAIKNWEADNSLKFECVPPEKWHEVYNVPPPKLWIQKYDYDVGEIWQRPLDELKYYDCAIGASITSAARAVLLEAIMCADRPIYCDTDSIVCEELNEVELHPSNLGAWDFEGGGDSLHIYGKKVYALFEGEKLVKKACKGVNLTGHQIKNLCNGHTVTWENMAPTFKLTGGVEFVQRILGAEKHTKLFDKKGSKIVAEKA